LSTAAVQPRRRRRPWLSKSLVFSGSIAAFFILAGVLAPVIAPADPLTVFPGQVLKPPSRDHLLGTDELGRDLLSRMLYGARLSLLISICSVSISCFFGVSLGIIAAYYGGIVDMAIMRVMDIILSFPSMILIIAVVAYLGNSVPNLIIVIGLLYTPRTARITYSTALSIRQMDYVEAAQMTGTPSWRIMLLHVLPNAIAPLLAHVALSLGFVILTESGLSFLGLGPPPPTPTWGQMIAVGRRYIHRQPLLLAVPVVALSLVILAYNMLSDCLRDILDPRVREA
jgi:ABC-type dipeptide/oligopeptide/nickel transport system permease subunit